MRRLALLLPLLGLVACDTKGVFVPIDPELNRMIRQPYERPYEENDFFDDRMAMRTPPEGTIAWDQVVDQPMLTTGQDGGKYAATLPIPADDALLARGRDRFDIYCAVCHGSMGAGQSVVGRAMKLVKPPSLHDPRIRAFPPGRIFSIITDGYGMMPSYAARLEVRDRWAVAAYVKALQLSQHAPLSDLPADVQQQADKELQ